MGLANFLELNMYICLVQCSNSMEGDGNVLLFTPQADSTRIHLEIAHGVNHTISDMKLWIECPRIGALEGVALVADQMVAQV